MLHIVRVILLIACVTCLFKVADADAKVWKHRHWYGTRVCHTFKNKHQRHHYFRHHKHRCHFRTSRELRQRRSAVKFAMAQRGKPYIWGATGPWGYDCSGLVYAAWRHAGRYIPRTTYGQLAVLGYHGGRPRLGDLMYMHVGHVAMFIGHGRVVVARHSGTTITTQPAWMHRNHIRSLRF